ncbi:sulfur globule protein precursor [Methylobacterium oxalidis]|uniref:Sulfur globule protein n=1 Tax=Methylobacterium oxalidis TaxID=944322 RepID=A0A512J8K6_9HYPH|nr:sulfur globule protein precursor [Methylobacterium oxalidis]GEP06268.1 hypothetical protein MOX02_43060 [Methylobacterium oxalidis]GJE30644.1 hypothetical protein LDDCCGHA_0813 [Methylobacterium oxalidis]GLS66067.1 hypothetical protein GCM10007888_44490 [Methylobacterium oxalidis]
MAHTLRTLAAALVLGGAALAAAPASAGGFHHHHGHHHHGHWGHGHFGHRHWGWGGPRLVGFMPAYYGACRVKRFIDEDGDLVVRRRCY